MTVVAGHFIQGRAGVAEYDGILGLVEFFISAQTAVIPDLLAHLIIVIQGVVIFSGYLV